MNIGDREVLRSQIGEHVIYEKTDYSNIWYQLKSSKFGNGRITTKTLMKYDPQAHTGTIWTDAIYIIRNGETVSGVIFELPDGFVFEGHNVLKATLAYLSVSNVAFSGSKVTATIKNTGPGSNNFTPKSWVFNVRKL